MKTVELKGKVREGHGKTAVKKIRKTGAVPGIIYGGKTEPISVEVDMKEFVAVIHGQAGENALIKLKLEGSKTKKEEHVMVSEIQHDVVSDRITHIDFRVVSLSEKIHAKVPVHEKGEPAGVKEGGVVDHVHREVDVECLPTALPDKIDLDISALKINDAILAKDIPLPAGVVCLLPPDEVILKVLPPKKEEAAAEVLPGEAKAEPEVITAKKPAAEEGAEAPKGGKKE